MYSCQAVPVAGISRQQSNLPTSASQLRYSDYAEALAA